MSIFRELSWAGRLGRGGFWLRHLLVLPLLLGAVLWAASWTGSATELAGATLLTLFLLSTWARRLHDRGRSAAWLLLTLIPVFGAVVLWVECGLRGTDSRAERFGPRAGISHDYLTVGAPVGDA